MLSIDMASMYHGLVIGVLERQRLVSRENTSVVLWFRHGQDVKGMLSELTFGDVGVEIHTYVRNDNSDALRQVDSVNVATSGKRSNGFLESNREEIEQKDWSIVGNIHGYMNTADGLTKAMSSANMRNLFF